MNKPKRILYVDDDADDRELLADAMQIADPEVELLFAENGADALQRLATIKNKNEGMPCLIILDINMPLLDGKETFDRLKEDEVFQRLPVIVFTSSEKPQDKTLFNNLGIQFFTKPSSVSYMSNIVHQMINACC